MFQAVCVTSSVMLENGCTFEIRGFTSKSLKCRILSLVSGKKDLCICFLQHRSLLDFEPSDALCLPEFSSPCLENCLSLLLVCKVDHLGFYFSVFQAIGLWLHGGIALHLHRCTGGVYC